MPPPLTPGGRRQRPYRAAAAALVLAATAYAAQVLWPGHAKLAADSPSCPVTASAAPAPAPVHDAPSGAALDGLRIAASLGNEDASATLAGVLLDQYEQLADASALFEALQWLERDLDSPRFLAFSLIDRVVQGPCMRDPALKWHWLCNQAE